MKSHTGSVFTLGKGAINWVRIIVDDKISKVMWIKRFLEHQNYHIHYNVIYQDNTSTMRIETNGKESCGKRTRHLDIKLFYITDLVARNEVTVQPMKC